MKKKKSRKLYAGKYISKQNIKTKKITIDWIKNEININKLLKNDKNIAKLTEVHETKKSIILLFKLIKGPTLSSSRIEEELTNINSIKKTIHSLLKNIQQLEKKGIVHRDIKPENLIFNKKNDFSSLMIIDFGLSCSLQSNTKTDLKIKKRICGTPGFIAPEVFKISSSNLEKTLTSKIDVFSAGVIFHKFLYGKFPFKLGGNNAMENKKGFIKIKSKDEMRTENKCPLAHDLLWRMLNPNFEKRISVTEALDHAFFSEVKDTVGWKKTGFSASTLLENSKIKIDDKLSFEAEFSSVPDEDRSIQHLGEVKRMLKFKNKFGEIKI